MCAAQVYRVFKTTKLYSEIATPIMTIDVGTDSNVRRKAGVYGI